MTPSRKYTSTFDDFMDHTPPRTVYPREQAVLNAINSVFSHNEDVFGIQWTNDLFEIPHVAADTVMAGLGSPFAVWRFFAAIAMYCTASSTTSRQRQVSRRPLQKQGRSASFMFRTRHIDRYVFSMGGDLQIDCHIHYTSHTCSFSGQLQHFNATVVGAQKAVCPIYLKHTPKNSNGNSPVTDLASNVGAKGSGSGTGTDTVGHIVSITTSCRPE
ncbi:hypothetical protein PG984_014202 [Apiospora sp. TS-2023a]